MERTLSRNGITPVIAVVLLLMMTVATAGGAYAWMQQVQNEAQEEASGSLAAELSVKDVRCSSGEVELSIKNGGDTAITGDTAEAYLYRDDGLIGEADVDIAGEAFQQPGGFAQVTFNVPGVMAPGTMHTVDFDIGGTVATGQCDPGGAAESCLAINGSAVDTGDGMYMVDTDGVGGNPPVRVGCDMGTDGGGWTVLSAYTGADGEAPLVNDTSVPGNPLEFEHVNTPVTFKMALASLSDETLFRRDDGTWIRTNRSIFDQGLDTTTHVHKPVLVTASDGTTDSTAVMGYSTRQDKLEGGGDFGIVSQSSGFDHHNDQYDHLRSSCDPMYLYGYSNNDHDWDAGYDVERGLGSWSGTQNCNSDEGGDLVFYVAVR